MISLQPYCLFINTLGEYRDGIHIKLSGQCVNQVFICGTVLQSKRLDFKSDDDQESANAEWKRLQSELRLTFF